MSCTNLIREEGYEKLKVYIDSLEEKQGSLITVLHKAQEIFGYLPEEVQEYVAINLNVPVSKVYGVVSFYQFFTMVPKGKYPVSVCLGTACYVRGAEKVLNNIKNYLGIDVGQTTEDGLFSIDCLRCVGACGMAPVVIIGKDVYGKDDVKDMKKILEKYRNLSK
ncbi:NAD(P)H-dependent oxidoreductase subunit E [Cetobacterium sp. SF1]|uniref:NADH-quinone oxidoreductase subunit NuoE family protein n=1 Tax=unclassified Cetobacterium TaxID=2630983 RepID=UPI003CF13FAF